MAINEAVFTQTPNDSNRIVQGLWIGPELSVMEQLSVTSFLRNGHEYHLYVYDQVKNIPAGAVVRDASEILTASRIFQYKHFPTYAGFSNFFRYKLLLERGGWWIDTDTVCLKPFDFAGGHVFASEEGEAGDLVTSGIIKAPVGSPVMAYAWEVCQSKDPEQLGWGETGPRLMGEAVRKFSMENEVKPHQVFCPVSYWEWRRVLEPVADGNGGRGSGAGGRSEVSSLYDDGAYAIHLWNEKWRASGQDKNAQYDPACLYEQLKRRYL